MNSQWFCFNDDSVYTCDLPTMPMYVYMAFYRPMPTIGTQVVKDLNMANVAKLTKSQVTLMFQQRPMPVRRLTRTSGKNTSNIQPHEGTFVSNTSNSTFIAKAKLRPKLITGTTTPTTRKKAESDLDYNPENDEDTQDTEEDVRLEKTAVREQAKKGYILFEYIILCIIVSTKSYVQIIYIIYCMSFLIFSPTTSIVQCFREKNVTRSGESNYFTDC